MASEPIASSVDRARTTIHPPADDRSLAQVRYAVMLARVTDRARLPSCWALAVEKIVVAGVIVLLAGGVTVVAEAAFQDRR